MEYLALGLGILSLFVSAFAVWLAIVSDRRMKALSNLQFQEKLAVMASHLKNLRGDKSALGAERILNDFEAASHLRKYVAKEKQEKMICDYIVPILKEYLGDKMEQGLAISVKGIIDIAASYRIESSELETLRQKARGIM
jgi:hypothetical protein